VLGFNFMEGKEKITLSDQDRESMGYAFLKAGEKELAKSQFLAAHWTEENIKKVLDEAASKNPEKGSKKMGSEEKKEFLKGMAEEFEEKAEKEEKEGKNKNINYYKELARAYRRELKEMEENENKNK